LLPKTVTAKRLPLALYALAIFPLAYAPITKMVTGKLPSDPKFQQERMAILYQLGAYSSRAPASGLPRYTELGVAATSRSAYAMSQAQEIVDGLSVKEYPVIIERNGELFIARHDLDAKQEVLVWLMRNASAQGSVLETKVGDSNKSRVRRKLKEMVADKLVGLAGNGEYFIMPRGQALVTTNSLLQYRP
jgi:hypothetical protein